MKNKRKTNRNAMRWWVAGYLVVLVMLTLRPFSGNVVVEKEFNVVLFHSIENYWRHMKNFGMINTGAWDHFPGDLLLFLRNFFTVSFVNLAGNVLLFMPLGFFLGGFFRKKKAIKTFFGSLLVSIGIEVAQYIGLSSRIADIDDVVLNAAGGLLGYGLYVLYDKWKKGSEVH